MKRKILVKPPLKETYINNANNEKVSYINLPEEYKEYSLEEDIKQGGIHLKSFWPDRKKEHFKSDFYNSRFSRNGTDVSSLFSHEYSREKRRI